MAAGYEGPICENPSIWEDIDPTIKDYVLDNGLSLESPLAVVIGMTLKNNTSETTSGGRGIYRANIRGKKDRINVPPSAQHL